MGKQINYYMDYESFLKVAQVALDEGCLIVSGGFADEKQIPTNDLSVISEKQLRYYFYLPELAELEYTQSDDGKYHLKTYDSETVLAIIEASFSKKYDNDKGKGMNQARLYIVTNAYKNGEWILRSEKLEKVYNKLVRAAKKVAPRTAIEYDAVDLIDGYYGEPYKDSYKEYISAECLRWVNDGYEIDLLKRLKDKFDIYLKETDNGQKQILKPQRIYLDRLNPKNKYPTFQNHLRPKMDFGSNELEQLYDKRDVELLRTAYNEVLKYLNNDQLCNNEKNMFPKKNRLTGEYYLESVSFMDYSFCSVRLNFLERKDDKKDDYLRLEIIFSYDKEEDKFSVREINSESI